MKISSLALSASLALLISCGSSDKKNEESFFPVVPILKSQVAQVDTTLNTIRQYVIIDSTNTDTIFVPRDQFRQLAKDFLNLPDISTPEYKKRYTETTQFDEQLDRAVFTYLPVKPEKELIQRQEVLIKHDAGGNDEVKTIIINTVNNTKDSAVQKRLLWQVDKSFQVTTTRQLMGQPETTTTVRVVWNEE